MNKDWAIINTQNVVISILLDTDMETTDTSNIPDMGGAVCFSGEWAYRGTPVVGSLWSGDLDKFFNP